MRVCMRRSWFLKVIKHVGNTNSSFRGFLYTTISSQSSDITCTVYDIILTINLLVCIQTPPQLYQEKRLDVIIKLIEKPTRYVKLCVS